MIGYSSWAGGGTNTSIVNLGTISAGTSGMSIILNPTDTFTNEGILSASNGGTLYLGGTFTTAQLGGFNSIGGTVNVTGTLQNSGTTEVLTAATGSLTLSGMIQGGTITASGGAELVPAGGTLDGVTVNGPMDLTASGADAYVTDGLTLNGTATLGASARLYFNGSQMLGGTGTVVFNNATYQGLIANTNNMTLTIGPGITIDGGNNQGSNVSSGSVIGYSSDFGGGSNASIVNLGTISAGTSGMSIVVNSNGSFTNQGTVSASNGGTLYLGGTVAQLGTFSSTGGTVALVGTLTNTGNTLALTAATGSLTLYGGTIQGGTVTATGGAQLVTTSSGGTLNGVTLNCNLGLTASSAYVSVINGLTLDGTATIGGNSGNGSNWLEFAGSQTLSGTGSIVFGSAGYTGLLVTQNSTTLTIGSGITVHGGSSGSYGRAWGMTRVAAEARTRRSSTRERSTPTRPGRGSRFIRAGAAKPSPIRGRSRPATAGRCTSAAM